MVERKDVEQILKCSSNNNLYVNVPFTGEHLEFHGNSIAAIRNIEKETKQRGSGAVIL